MSAARLARVLGQWRRGGARRGATDLFAAIRLQVLDGQLPVGTGLPAEREMAKALGVSRTMVGTALDLLRESGLVASRQGSGSWITSTSASVPSPAAHRDPELIDFARASPPAAAGVLPAVDRARAALPAELDEHGYSDQGLRELRTRIAERYTARGLPTQAGQIMVTNGAQHAFALILRTLTGPGDRVLVEQPTYPNTLEAVRSANLIGVPAALDPENGWDIAGIEASLRQAAPRLAYLIVDFHNPTGLRLDAAARARLGEVLAGQRTPVVADETFAELDLETDPADAPPPLAAFAGDWTLCIGSAAKTYWGGLRLGWIRAPEALIGRLLFARHGLDLGSPVLDQLVLGELLGEHEPVLRQRRADIRTRRDTLVDELRAKCPEWSFRVPSGGLSLWCHLPRAMSSRLAVAAGKHGLALAPGPRFGVHGGFEHWVKLPFTLSEERLRDAVDRLSLAAASLGDTASGGEALDIAVS